MTKNLLRSFVVLLAIAASTTCAWAKVCPAPTSVTDNTVRTQPQRFSSTVNLADLIEGDTLLQGFSINFELTSGMDLQRLTINAGRCYLNIGIVPTDDMNFTVSNESSMSYTDTCGIASQALTWYPYTGTAIGDAWVVTSVEDEDALGGNTIRAVRIAGIQMPPMVWTSGTCTVSLIESSGVMTVTPTTPGVDGVMDNYSGYTSEPWTNYRTKVKSVVVEQGVTYIGQNCFGYFPNTTSLSLPAGLKVMGSNAVTSTKLTSIELPDGMQSLRGATFGGNMYLQTVTIHRIDSLVGSTFAGTSVNSVTIDSVGFMGSSMFGGVGSIRNVTIGTVGIISDYCFSSCGSSSSPGKLIIGSVGIMMQGAVSNFWGLDTIRIGVADSLCTQAFNSSGKKVFIGSIRHLGQRAFYNCNQLTEATIDNISILGKEAFYYCNNISDIYFSFTPDQITWNNPDLGFKDNKATNCHVTAASLSAWESTFPTANVTFVGDIPVPHTARMAEGTEDLEHWTITPAEATTTGVMPGSTLTATYSGTRKVKSVKAVKYVDPMTLPLTIEALNNGTITVQGPKAGMQYSLNGAAKAAVSGSSWSITVAPGDKVSFYGNGTSITSYYNSYYNTKINGSEGFTCKVYGNIMSLIDEENFATATTLTANLTFANLFQNNTSLVDASNLMLPATTLAQQCYSGMFYGCSSLTAAPALPATTLKSGCYSLMFYGCSALIAAPALPATTLDQYCYNQMFYGCSSLTAAPALPATTLAQQCYYGMFQGCTGLTAAPVLPATTLATECYGSMFAGDINLTAAPALPATTLAQGCYYNMFYGCSGLTAAPALPATTLADNCYAYMFQYCSGLTAAPALPATTLTNQCYNGMFYGCSGLTAAPALPATTLANNCYSYMFNGCSMLSSVTCLATDISASYCTDNWLTGVAATGTIITPSSTNWSTGASTDWPYGYNGIPDGWTRVDYVE